MQVVIGESYSIGRNLIFTYFLACICFPTEARGKSNVFSYGGSEGQADKEQGGASEVVATSRPKKIKGASLFNPNTKR